MPDQIPPALSAETLDGYVNMGTGVIDVVIGGPGGARDRSLEIASLIKLLNDALPDSDPRKITRAHVRAMRFLVQACDEFGTEAGAAEKMISEFADALESYLPPEER